MVGVVAIYFCLPKFTHYLFELENWSILLKGNNWPKTKETCWGQEGHWKKKHHWLGGGFKYFLFSPRTLGNKINFNEYFSKGRLKPTASWILKCTSYPFLHWICFKTKQFPQLKGHHIHDFQAFCACLSELLGTLASWSRRDMAPVVFCLGERVEWTTGTGWFCMLLLENF